MLEKSFEILPTRGADEECDAADAAVEEIEEALQALLDEARRTLK